MENQMLAYEDLIYDKGSISFHWVKNGSLSKLSMLSIWKIVVWNTILYFVPKQILNALKI